VKNEILHKATQMFLDLGFKSVTMDDLAKELAISKKTIYSFFDNKTALVECCTLQLCKTISANIKELATKNLHPIDELFEVRQIVRRFLKNEQSSPQYQLQKYFPSLFKKLKDEQLMMMREFLMRNLSKGIEIGVYREDLNPEMVFRLYFYTYFSLRDPQLYPEKIFNAQELIFEHINYHIRGIATPKGADYLNNYLDQSSL
jgi:TetR/AcrR family transcriptional regulator, cholesterol catabolism regulator